MEQFINEPEIMIWYKNNKVSMNQDKIFVCDYFQCKKCMEIVHKDEFIFNKQYSSKKDTNIYYPQYCKKCWKKKTIKYNDKQDKDKIKERQKKYYQNRKNKKEELRKQNDEFQKMIENLNKEVDNLKNDITNLKTT